MDHARIIIPTTQHTHTIILLHGRDSAALDFANEFFESQASDDRTLPEIFPSFKWIFPSSKSRMSARFESGLSQWFDIWSVETPEERKDLQVEGLRQSLALIRGVVNDEAKLVAPNRIFLGGISQGGATAIHVLLSDTKCLAGFIGLCSWLPLQGEVARIAAAIQIKEKKKNSEPEQPPSTDMALYPEPDRNTPCLKTPVFLSHSIDDDVVPVANGDRLCLGLRQLGMIVTCKVYEDGGHWVNEPQGIDDMVTFIQNNRNDD